MQISFHLTIVVALPTAVVLGRLSPDAKETLFILAKRAANDDDFFVTLAANKAIQQIRGK